MPRPASVCGKLPIDRDAAGRKEAGMKAILEPAPRPRGDRARRRGLVRLRRPARSISPAARPSPLQTTKRPTRPASRHRFASADLIERGEYLALAGDCTACHTVKGGKPFAGGFAFKLPFGTLYSSNITPDKETGIGAWSDADFLEARASRAWRRTARISIPPSPTPPTR